MGDVRAKVIVLFDNCPREYEDLFNGNFDRQDLEFIHLDGVGNLATFGKQIDILLEQKYSDTVYFSEDDYYYFPNAFAEMINLLKRKDVDFVSPYDPLDYYDSILHHHKVMVQATDQRHWKTSNSTCLTFMTTKKNLYATRHVFRSYTKGNQDSSLWLSLTKEHVCNPLRVVDSLIRRLTRKDSLADLVILIAWYYCGRQILFGKKYHLWTPMPTVGIHLERQFLPPTKASVQHMLSSAEHQEHGSCDASR